MSLKIINLQNIGDNLTVDNTFISVDSDLITADQTLIEPSLYTLKIPYRKFTPVVKLYIWNEIKETETIITITVGNEPGLMVLEFGYPFVDGETYEVKVLNDSNDELVWRGKILSTTQTDLENYILHKNDNGIIKI